MNGPKGINTKVSVVPNQNFRMVARLRPNTGNPIIEVTDNNNLTLQDIYQKSKGETLSYMFHQIFDSEATQDQVFKYVQESTVNRLIDGNNACILCYGQTGAGKTYTMFGDDGRKTLALNLGRGIDRRGILPLSVEFLFKRAQDYQETREFVLTCSFYEIYLDQVRDLGRGFKKTNAPAGGIGTALGNALKVPAGRHPNLPFLNVEKDYDEENLEIFENANGQVNIRGLTQVEIHNVDELMEMLTIGFEYREKFEAKYRKSISNRAHTIFTLNLLQRDKENDNLPLNNSTIAFVDLAGSERIAKSVTEGQKFQESIQISSSLNMMGKVLQAIASSNQKSAPYKETKVTKALQNCLGASCAVLCLINLDPVTKNFDECLSSLAFSEKLRSVETGTKTKATNQDDFANEISMGIHPHTEKVLKKMNDEYNELKRQVENYQKDSKRKFEEAAKLLSIDFDIEKMLNKKDAREWSEYRQLRETMSKGEQLKRQIEDWESRNERLERGIEEVKKDEALKEEKLLAQIISLKEQIRFLQEQKMVANLNAKEITRRSELAKKADIDKIRENNTNILNEKLKIINNFPVKIKPGEEEFSEAKLDQIRADTKVNSEAKYQSRLNLIKNETDKLANATQEQFQSWLDSKTAEIETFQAQLKEYHKKKAKRVGEMNDEMKDIYGIIMKQKRVIDNLENGVYTQGTRVPVLYDIKERISTFPNRSMFPHLYKLLEEQHVIPQLSVTVRDEPVPELSKTSGSQGMGASMKKTDSVVLSDGKKPVEPTPQKPAAPGKPGDLPGKIGEATKKEEEADIFDPAKPLNDVTSVDELRRYGDEAQKMLRDLLDKEKAMKTKVDAYQAKLGVEELDVILADIERYKTGYQELSRKNDDRRLLMSAQKHKLETSGALGAGNITTAQFGGGLASLGNLGVSRPGTSSQFGTLNTRPNTTQAFGVRKAWS